MDNTQNNNESVRDLDSQLESIRNEMLSMKQELNICKKTTKNALKLSIIVGLACFFFVALNFSILFTVAGGVAGNERKIQSIQEHSLHIRK